MSKPTECSKCRETPVVPGTGYCATCLDQEKSAAVFPADLLKVAEAPPWRDCPIGTTAHSHTGSTWTKEANGWWVSRSGSSFPTPGGDACLVRLPELLLSVDICLPCPFCGEAPSVTDMHSDEMRRRDDEARAKGHIIPGVYVAWKSHFLRIACSLCGIAFDGTQVDACGPFTDADVRKSRARILAKWNIRKGAGGN